jgi:branched-chain amino acid transport system ATP-binding protein
MSLLHIQQIQKSFGANQAVKGISFDVEAGEMLAMIGPNGAGKSTTFNMLNGQIRPDAGDIVFMGRSLIGRSPREIWQMGVGRTFQVAQTFGSMSLAENVQMALLSSASKVYALWQRATLFKRDEAIELLRLVGLETQADKACSALAYGDVKRLELAMALANQPTLLLMDEPTAGMASGERNNLMALTKDLVLDRKSRPNGLAVLFTEHSMDVVFGYADRVMVLARGELIAQGSPQEVRDHALVQSVYLGYGQTFQGVNA